MKLNERRDEGFVSTIPMSDRGSFTISANGKAFDVLSSMLYQDKIGSIVREISSNALDAHSEAGWPERPFEIHLPSQMEPYFSVKDYGIGMDEDTVANVFTVMFKSTKENSNTSIGAFGLGAKTPFAYTDSFTVVAIKDGISRTFNMCKQEDGSPVHIRLIEKKTSEENGVEIIIPVNDHSDRAEFVRAIANQLHFFPVRPTIKGFNNVPWMDEPTSNVLILSHRNIDTYKSHGNYRTGCIAVMGPVGYAVNFDILRDKLSAHNDLISWISSRVTRIRFNIGQISVTPSRENLSYDAKTLKAFNQAFDGYVEELTKSFERQLSSFTSPWEKAKFIYTSVDDVSGLIKIKHSKEDGIVRYHGKSPYFDVDSIKEELGDSVTGLAIYRNNDLVGSKSPSSRHRVNYNEFVNTGRNYVVIVDSCKYTKRRYITLHNENVYKNCFVIVPANDKEVEAIQKVFTDSGIPSKLLSEFEPAELGRDYGFVKAQGYIIQHANIGQGYGFAQTRVGWEKITDKSKIEPAFYLVSDRGTLQNSGAEIKRYAEALALGLVKDEHKLDIYAFPVKTAEKIADDEDWISLSDFVKDNYSDAKLADIYSDVWESSVYRDIFGALKRSMTTTKMNMLLTIPVIKEWFLSLELDLFGMGDIADSYSNDNLNAILAQCRDGKYSYASNTVVSALRGALDKFVAHYPMLKFIDTYHFNDKDFAAMGEYLQLYTEKHGATEIDTVDVIGIIDGILHPKQVLTTPID